MPEKKEIPVKDFLEEHRRLKEGNASAPPALPPSAPATVQPSRTPAPTSSPAPAAPTTPALAHPSAPQGASDSGPISFVQLVESLKSLGYDVRPLESLRSFAEQLDSEEQKLMREISERQKRLETVRMARRLLKILGV